MNALPGGSDVLGAPPPAESLAPSVDALLRRQGAPDPQRLRARRPDVAAVAEEARRQAQALAAPAWAASVQRVASVRHDRVLLASGGGFTAPLAARVLGRAEYVCAAVCTIGPALEQAVSQAYADHPALALALDAAGSAIVEALADAAAARIGGAAGGCVTAPIAPGHEGFPLDPGQRDLLRLFAAPGLPVTLSEAAALRPAKSVSFVAGIGPDVEAGGSVCDWCGARLRCRLRRAEAPEPRS